MKNLSHAYSQKNLRLALVTVISFLAACQSLPPVENENIDSDVCIGEAVVVDPDKPIDLEEMANQTDCE